ncbi:glycosyltransferase family 4 protein [bacterium]|nr:glycosyltransferase family 4 protein [bacterium]
MNDFRQRHGFGDYRWVTFIGTFATQYDIDTMLAVCSHFSKNTDVRFAFIGAGSQVESLKQKVREAQFDNVEVLDWISHDEIPAAWCMSAITFFALRPQALYRGTIPAKLYEALACGIPVVAAVEGAAAQMITESGAGVTVPCQDVSGLVAGIETLLADADRQGQYRHAGRAYAERQFNPERVADAYEETLRLAYMSRRSRSGKSSASDSRR